MTTKLLRDETRSPGPASVGDRSVLASRLSQALTNHRRELAQALLPGIADWPKYEGQIGEGAERDEFVRRELYALIDYLAIYFRTGELAYKSLYIGEKLKQIHHPQDDLETRRDRSERLLDADEAALLTGLASRVSPAELDLLREVLDVTRRVVLSEAPKTLTVLFVGDCLYLDIQAFLPPPCLEDGVALVPEFLASKNGVILRNEIRTLVGRKIDLVFYSPFSYAFSPALAATHGMKRAWHGTAKIKPLVDEAMGDAEATLNLLASAFDCPILVHNTVNLVRHDGSAREKAKIVLTSRTRRIARDMVNARLVEAMDRANAASFEHLFLIDEMPLLDRHSELELGRMFYDSDVQHPAVLGSLIADRYREIVAAHVELAGRKLVVCDLDNTLWAGEIGEGKVTHFLDRQSILRRLRDKGVVLAINSKNDARNVHWDGALLSADDFVSSQINWDSKIVNMKRIHEALNLKYKDYVFIDDRGDQLAQVSEALPEIRALDATLPRTWQRLAEWEAMLPRPLDGDRTQLYREREAREGFVAALAEEDQAALFANLQIRVTLRHAARADLHRVTELINRTNQFNLAGSRTNFNEVSSWLNPPHDLIVVEAADKFGQMGLISVALFKQEGHTLHIPVFVLSCRVFGYGIEKAVINLAKRLASARGPAAPLTLVGAYQETSHNAPCRAMYGEQGFTFQDGSWIFAEGEAGPDEEWLTIDDRVTATART